MPEPTEYTVKCEFCGQMVTYGVTRDNRMEVVFADHYMNACQKTLARLVSVIYYMINSETGDHVSTYHYNDA